MAEITSTTHPDAADQMPGTYRGLAWLPIPVLLAAIIAARAADLTGSYEFQTLTIILSFTFYTMASLGAIILIGRSFLASGTPALLLLECGVILWSLAGTVGDVVSHGDANVNVTIFNTAILLAGGCILAGAILSLKAQRALHARILWLGAGAVLALGALALVTWAALAHRLPVFFILGQGGMPVRSWVLASAISMFVLSASLMLADERRTHSLFTFRYALALLLLAVGLFGVMIQLSLGSVVNWLGRTAQWLGGFYLLLAAVAAQRESGLVLFLPKEELRPAFYREALAVVLVMAAAAVRFVFLPVLGMQAPFVTFYPAVILAALYGGFRAGLIATIGSALLTNYFWMEPGGRFGIASPGDGLAIAIFLMSCTMISLVIEAMHTARARAYRAETEALLSAQRMMAAETMRKSEEKYHVLFTGMAEGFAIHEIITDEQGTPVDFRFLDINPAFERLTGLKRGDVIGKTQNEVLPDNDPMWLRMFGEVALTGEPVQFQNYSPILNRHYDVLAYRPAPCQFAVIFMDITGRKKAEELLAADSAAIMRLQQIGNHFVKEGEFSDILGEIVEAAIDMAHADMGNIQLYDAHSGCLKIAAYKGFQQPFLDFWDSVAEGRGCCGTALRNAQRTIVEDVARSPVFAGTPALEVLIAAGVRAVQSTPLLGRDGVVIGMLSTHWRVPHRPEERELRLLDLLAQEAVDIIERARADEALKEQTRQLVAANKELGSFSYSVSHDLRAPLRAIDGFSRILLRKINDKLNDDEKRQFEVIRENTAKMGRLIDRLLEFSRLDRQFMSVAEVNMPELVKDVWDELLTINPACKVPLKINNLPSACGDAALIRQVLINLLSNAVKFTQYREEPVIEIGGRIENSEIVYFVRDNGVGFDMQYYKKLFGVFQRLHSQEEFEGIGAGLAIVQRIIKRHGGNVWAEGAVEKGASFYFTLPSTCSK